MSHPFVLMLEQEPLQGHIFGVLKVERSGEFIAIEKRCVLCQSLLIDLLMIDGSIQECSGLFLGMEGKS